MQPQTAAMIALAEKGPTIDVGAGGRRVAPGVIAVDAVAHPGTTVVADIGHLPFREESVTGLICTGTLEHVPDPVRALERDWPELLPQYEEMYRRGAYLPRQESDPVREKVRSLAREHGVRDRRRVRLAHGIGHGRGMGCHRGSKDSVSAAAGAPPGPPGRRRARPAAPARGSRWTTGRRTLRLLPARSATVPSQGNLNYGHDH